MAPAPASPRTRDADRSRAAILDAGEELFAERGFESTTLAEIGARAGVSRGTPSYFFGSKEALYAAVLDRLFAEREAQLRPAFEPLRRWAAERDPEQPLEAVLDRAVGGYLRFLHGRPGFVAIVEREALAGGERLRARRAQSTVVEEAFAALRRSARSHGLRRFDVAEAILCLVGLALVPLAHRHTLLRRHDLDPDSRRFVAARRRHIVRVLAQLMRG